MEVIRDKAPSSEANARSRLALALFAFLDSVGLRYCVVGDTRAYPDAIGDDVDIVVPQRMLSLMPALINQYCEAQGLHLIQLLQHEQTALYFVLASHNDQGQLAVIVPDLCGDYRRNGKLFLEADELLNSRTAATDAKGKSKGFYVAAPAFEFVYYLLKKIDKPQLTARNGDHLSAQWGRDPEGALANVRRFWSAQNAVLLAEAADRNDWQRVQAALPTLQGDLHTHLAFSLASRWGEFRRKARRVLQPTGLFLAFMGPDGSGKSSVIEQVRAHLAPAFRRTSYLHLRPEFGKPLEEGNCKPAPDPHGQTPRGPLGSAAKVLFYLLDYNLGYLAKVKPRLVYSTLVIFDRYYHDLLVDPTRYRYGGPRGLARLAGKLLPHPDLFIFLDAPAEVLQARKQEVSFEETARQREGYLHLAQDVPNGHVIDASRPLGEVVTQVERVVMRHLEERTKRRLVLGPRS